PRTVRNRCRSLPIATHARRRARQDGRPGSGPGWSVVIAPGLPVAGVAGVMLLAGLAVAAVARRRG
ncbi:MAG: hypothetical protein ACREQ5_27840, partial [Candidatus Dormibacteria bacterium]